MRTQAARTRRMEARREARRRTPRPQGVGRTPKGRWLDAALEVIGMVVAVAIFGGLLWLYLVATPDQASAEADIGRSQIGHQHCRAANRAQIGHQHSRAANRAQIGPRHDGAAK